MSTATEKRSCQRAHPLLKNGQYCMTMLSDDNAAEYTCAIIDISSGGALLRTDAEVNVDDAVDIGGVEASVIRRTDDHVAVAFSNVSANITMKTFAEGVANPY